MNSQENQLKFSLNTQLNKKKSLTKMFINEIVIELQKRQNISKDFASVAMQVRRLFMNSV